MRKFTIYNRIKRPEIKQPETIGYYIEYEVHQEKKSTGPGVDDFEIVDVLEERKTNIKEFINSYNDKAGIDAVIKIINATGDVSLLNQIEPQYMDTTIIPNDPEEAFNLANSPEAAFAALDPELVGDEDMESFIKNLTPEKLKAYIEKKVKEKQEHESSSELK